MSRTNRIALLAAACLVVALTGTVLATRAPDAPSAPAQLTSSHEPQDEVETEDEDAPPTAEDLANAVARLGARGFATDEATLADLASRHGLGGAVRLTAWSAQSGESVATLEARRAEGIGWGRMARDLGLHPGIGWIMGNGDAAGGLGRENAPGQQDDAGD